MDIPDQSIVQFVDDVLCNAVCIGASDIHFELFESDFLVRYRINGALYDHAHLPHEVGYPIIMRIKLLAKLNIAESRRPQDGNISQLINESTVEFRVSSLPTQFGESVVLRVLQSVKNIPNLYSLASADKTFLENLPTILSHPGITLLAGPTGCGKTTTIYSLLNELNTDEVKILTCEDPVEYIVDGISQSNINEDVGFSRILRSFLRHDPDVILVGEIRDQETAKLAIRAALTGHIVFSTIHANDSINAIPRLLDLGVDKNMLAEAINCIISQRLLPVYRDDRVIYREAKFETLIFSEHIKSAIKSDKSTNELRTIAISQRMIPLNC